MPQGVTSGPQVSAQDTAKNSGALSHGLPAPQPTSPPTSPAATDTSCHGKQISPRDGLLPMEPHLALSVYLSLAG